MGQRIGGCSMEITRVEQYILEVFRSIKTAAPNICATELHCEGWLLRLVLAAWSNGIGCPPFSLVPGSRWFAAPLLYSAFLAERRGDTFAETHSEADAVVGHFEFGSTKTGVRLTRSASQFVVLEAKVFSALGAGTKNAPEYDQAARMVGCMAETLRRVGRPLDQYQSLSFFVLAPEKEIQKGRFSKQIDPSHIRDVIKQRCLLYPAEARQQELRAWLEAWVCPLTETLQLGCVSWEDIIRRIIVADKDFGLEIQRFYEDCLRYNGPNRGIPIPGQPFSVLPV